MINITLLNLITRFGNFLNSPISKQFHKLNICIDVKATHEIISYNITGLDRTRGTPVGWSNYTKLFLILNHNT